MLSLHTWPTWNHGSPAEGVSYLLRDLPIPNGEFAFGRTKLFVRSPRTVSAIHLKKMEIMLMTYVYFNYLFSFKVFELEEFRRERLYDLAVYIQKTWRGYRQRKHFLCMRESQIIIASAWRSWRVSFSIFALTF